MDTGTVLEIIKMIEVRLTNLDTRLADENSSLQPEEYYGAVKELTAFRDHLQSFIEAQLNAFENQSTEP